MNRREFLWSTAMATGATALAPCLLRAADSGHRILKSIKFQMLKEPKLSIVDKFNLLRDLGFDGVELNSPGGVDKKEAREASAKTGFPIHGAVNSVHWNTRLSDPDPAVRQKSVEALKTAIRDVRFCGGSAVLLVPGKVTNAENENHDQVWERSIAGIRQALPLASKLGIHILIENVWNGFLYDPKGGADQTADLIARYLDEIGSPWVGSYFDIGNHQKFGNPADWIRTLGKRVVKLDAKGYSRKEGRFHKIGDGDIDWADVRKALAEIGFTGWSTAETGGGDRKRIKEVSERMDKHLLGI